MKTQGKRVDLTSFPVLVTFATLYYSAFIFVVSAITYIYSNILNVTGSASHLLQANGNVLLVDHLAIVFKIATSIPKNISNIILIVIFWSLMLILLAFIESGIYGYTLASSTQIEISFLDSVRKNWKKLLLFLTYFTPIFIFTGLAGFFAEFFMLKTELPITIVKITSFILMSSVLIPFIPARFYYLDGNNFRESLIFSLENFRSYATSTFLIIIPVGLVFLLTSNQLISNPDSILTIISYSPLTVILGIASWFFYTASISRVGKNI
ncbi:MAG: hypothetical protein R2883_06820 [Caldisericia bacterium]